MVFSSPTFLFVFLPIILALYFVIKNKVYRNIILLIFSLLFYAWGEPKYVLLMVISIVYNWAFAFAIEKSTNKSRAKLLMILAVIINIAAIGVFKYLDFGITNVNTLFGLNIIPPGIALPIGISFYTFQALSYVIDVYRRDVSAQKNVLYVGMYITMFPQLIAGPIVRYKDIETEIINRKESVAEFCEGSKIFIIGFAKKCILANTMAIVANAAFSAPPQSLEAASAWFGVIAFTFQIYFDFSGYSDMAIGLGRMFGFHFKQNFNYPYISKSITDFWRRWHMSLSSFFRDYVYIPLGGNRVSKPRFILNIFIVWFLTGLWHGASWNYVLWGLYFAVFLLIEKLIIGRYISKSGVLQYVYALFFIMMGWVIFKIEDVTQIGPYIVSMFSGFGDVSLRSLNILQFWPWFIVCGVCATPLLFNLTQKLKGHFGGRIVLNTSLLVIFGVSILFMTTSSFNPFIYFRF